MAKQNKGGNGTMQKPEENQAVVVDENKAEVLDQGDSDATENGTDAQESENETVAEEVTVTEPVDEKVSLTDLAKAQTEKAPTMLDAVVVGNPIVNQYRNRLTVNLDKMDKPYILDVEMQENIRIYREFVDTVVEVINHADNAVVHGVLRFLADEIGKRPNVFGDNRLYVPVTSTKFTPEGRERYENIMTVVKSLAAEIRPQAKALEKLLTKYVKSENIERLVNAFGKLKK